MAKPPKKPKKTADTAKLREKFTGQTGKPINNGQMVSKIAKLQRKAYAGTRLPAGDRSEALQEALAELGIKRA
jgi:hypothetical protein